MPQDLLPSTLAALHVLGIDVSARLSSNTIYSQTGQMGLPAGLASADLPGLLLQAVIVPGENTDDGLIVQAVAVPWLEIIALIQRDPKALDEIDWRKFEEIIAGAWSEWSKPFHGEVILTPRKGDKGRDVIVTLPGAQCAAVRSGEAI